MIKHSLLALAVLALAGCSGEPAPAPTPTGPPHAREYATAADVKDAAVAAGYPCPNWNESNRVKLAASSGECSGADVFSVYLTQQDVSTSVQNLKTVSQGPVNLLTGPNWIINAPHSSLLMIQKKMGGTLVHQVAKQ